MCDYLSRGLLGSGSLDPILAQRQRGGSVLGNTQWCVEHILAYTSVTGAWLVARWELQFAVAGGAQSLS